jgi:hypothetical protein
MQKYCLRVLPRLDDIIHKTGYVDNHHTLATHPHTTNYMAT